MRRRSERARNEGASERHTSLAALGGSAAVVAGVARWQWHHLAGIGAAPIVAVTVLSVAAGVALRLSPAGGFARLTEWLEPPRVLGLRSGVLGRSETGRRGAVPREARWATAGDAALLRVVRAERSRLVLGTAGRKLLACEPNQSLVVIGPTQTMKTAGLAIPAILEWDGPVLATSVKSDLLRSTYGWRSTLGHASVFDPTGSTGYETSEWSPLAGAGTWATARRTAAAMCDAVRTGEGRLDEADFWYSLAAKLLAPLLLAANTGGLGMADVLRWVDTQEMSEVHELLEGGGHQDAIRAAHASWAREERQRGSVYTTAETVLEPFAERSPVPASGLIDLGRLLGGGSDTLYLCAPAHDQSRLRPLFSSLVTEVLRQAYAASARRGAPLDPPLLVVLDEAANIAPPAELDVLAATAAGHGIQLVTVFQDLAQVAARYGARSATVFNNHRAKLVLSGVSDQATLEQASSLAGEADLMSYSLSRDGRGGLSTVRSPVPKRLATPDRIRRTRPGHALLIYGHLPPVELRLRPFFGDPRLASKAASGSSAPPSDG